VFHRPDGHEKNRVAAFDPLGIEFKDLMKAETNELEKQQLSTSGFLGAKSIDKKR